MLRKVILSVALAAGILGGVALTTTSADAASPPTTHRQAQRARASGHRAYGRGHVRHHNRRFAQRGARHVGHRGYHARYWRYHR